ncbi:MAG: Ig-like domain-containing protein [Rhodopirellula sp. JB044]|uniref:Ig-like domain-containing protein n=1 Tax=Rhodopirellula sp. JB044 TaxID=3342844 RepID=UPI003709E1B1
MNLAQKLRQRLARMVAMDAAGRGDQAKISADRGRLLLETLEGRQMMAGDVELLFTDPSAPAENVAAFTDESSTETSSTDRGSSNVEAEGEPGLDLVELAKWLDQTGFEFYGADWCPACTQQKQLFEDGAQYLPFTDVTLPDATRSQDPQFASLQITSYPTWIFPDNSRHEEILTIEELIQASGFVNPTDERPTFAEIGDQTVAIGSPLHIPVDGYDAEGGPLTVTVSVANPSLLTAEVITGNRSLRLDMDGYGDMVFELFEQRAPVAAGRVATLAESGFYDGIIFHRVDGDFVIQAGDPGGTGTGGSSLGTFDDDFHPDLQHNRTGVLSFAKSSDDTNNSQFFVTETDARFLDFNHSVFGQLVEGEDVREAISQNHTDSNEKPTNTVTINNATIFEDTENSVVMLKALGGTGTTNVTFTITDQDGNQYQEIVEVTVTEDLSLQGVPINSQPYLQPIADPILANGNVAQLQLESVDVEGDPVSYFIGGTSSSEVTAVVNPTTGLVEVTAADGFTGDVNVSVGVFATTGAGSASDTQVVTFTFDDSAILAPSSIDLRSSSDSGSSSTDNVTNIGSLTFDITGVTSGATVQIIDTSDNSVIGVGVATGSTIAVTTNNLSAMGQGSYTLAARQVIDGTAGPLSSSITVLYDTTAPTFDVNNIKTTGNANTAYTTDLVSAEEGSGVTYALSTFPTGATIVANTGVINWTPSEANIGSNDFTVTLTDSAGNVRTESFSVTVAGEPLAGIKVEATDLNGNVITSLDVGDTFLLRFYGTDERERGSQGGIYAAYADIVFDGTLVRAVPGSSIEYETTFGVTRSGTVGTGLIDDIGAVSSSTAPSNELESLIATIEMEALAAGTVNFVTDPADASNREVLLFFNNNNIPADAVDYGSVSLAIGQSFTAIADTFTVVEDSGATVLDVLANDTVTSGSGSLSVVSVTQPTSGGTVSLNNGDVTFTPATDFVGTAEFTYRVSGPGGVQETVPVTVTVTGTNDPPVGVDDTFIVDADSSNNSLDVLANEASTAEEGETLTVTGVTTPSNGGSVTIASDGLSVNYTPPASFVGTVTFEYTLSDGTSTDTVSVTVTVNPTDNPPTANDDTFPASGDPAINEDAAQASYDVLANDTRDTDNQAFEITAVGTPSAGGTVSIGNNGSTLLYQPAANFNGTETVTYTIRDTGGGLATATATFVVTSVNDAPPISAGSITLVKGSTAQTVLSISDLPDNVDTDETLSFVDLTTPSSGTATVSSDGQSILFTPADADFTGEVTFEFSVEDSNGLTSGPATMTVTVADYELRAIDIQFRSSTFGLLSGDLSQFTLTGTDVLNQPVTLPLNDSSVLVTADGISVPNLLPGSYQLNIPAVPFLHNGDEAQTIEIESEVDEGDESIELNLGSVKAEYYSVSDWFGSAPRLAVLAAVSPGSSAVYAQASTAALDVVSDMNVQLNDDGTAVTVNGTIPAPSGSTSTTPVAGSLSANVVDTTVVGTRGEAGDMRLVLISLENSAGELSLSESSASAAAVAAAASSITDVFVPEGEPLSQADLATLQTTPADDSEDDSTSEPSGEPISLGESISQSSVTSTTANVDAAMNEVSETLEVISPAGDRVAEQTSDGVQTFTEAVDEVLTNADAT